MGKIRIHVAAKSLGVPNELIMECLQHMDASVKNHMSSVDETYVELVKQVFVAGSKNPGASLENLAKDIVREALEKERVREEEDKKAKKKAKAAKKEQEDAQAQETGAAEAAPEVGPTPQKLPEIAIPLPLPLPSPPAKDGRGQKAPPKKKSQKKERQDEATDTDMYSSPAKRLDAIRKRKGQLRGSRGTKTTFVQKNAMRGRSGQPMAPEEREINRNIRLGQAATVKDLSQETGIKAADIIKFLFKELSVVATINQGLDRDVIQLVADHFGFEVQFKEETVSEEIVLAEDKPEDLHTRPPVIAIMGHVDHGKTKLLDTIRKTNVAAGESGGITQHIGAYQIVHNNRPITFLDTPGHESFTALRARGAKITDITILVVAADDGVMPQTLEAIRHAREAGVPILVAINKIDKQQANPDRVKQQLTDHGLQPEDWGGDTIYVPISALIGTGIPDLLDMIFLLADVQELKANPLRKANGTVIEGQLDRGKGPVATILVQNGTLYQGDYVVAGLTWGKIRSMENDRGENLPMAGPSTPIKVFGLNEVAMAGDRIIVVENEKVAKEISDKRKLRRREETLSYQTRMSMDQLFNRIQEGKIKELKVIVKGDVQGSIEAIVQSLKGIKHAEVRVEVIHQGVGDITESDVNLAAASEAIVLGFGVNPTPFARSLAAHEKVEIRLYNIIYNLIDDVKMALSGLLDLEAVEVPTGKAEVRQLFYSAKAGTIAGCYMLEGEIESTNRARVHRDDKVIFEGALAGLRRFKEDVKKVSSGYECGISLEGFNDCKEGDVISCFSLKKQKRELE